MKQLIVLAVVAGGFTLLFQATSAIWRSRRASVGVLFPVFIVMAVGTSADTALIPDTKIRTAIVAGFVLLGTIMLSTAPKRRLGSHVLNGMYLALALATVFGFAMNVILASDTSVATLFGRIIPFLVWTFFALAIRSGVLNPRDILLLVVALFGLYCVVCGLVADAWSNCSVFKCGPYGELLSGAFKSENGFARLASLGILCALGASSHNRKMAIAASLTTAIVLYASGSRTSQLAMALSLVGWYLWLHIRPAARRIVTTVMPVLLVAIGGLLVYNATPKELSDRGGIWILGTTAIGDHWVFGRGLDNWTPHVLSRNYMHSQFLLLEYAGGIVLIAIYVVVLWILSAAAARSASGFTFGLAVFVGVSGLAEILWNPIAVDITVPVVLLLLGVPAVNDWSRWDSSLDDPTDPVARPAS